MYPLKESSPAFVRNAWYVAAWSDEVGRSLLARTILNEPLVLYRTEAGQPVAFDNRCPHRRFPLSKGRLVGDAIQCGYHGFTYNSGGKCIRIPSQDQIPQHYAVRQYPLHEKWQWIWIWMGDPALADPSTIPDHGPARVEDPEWVSAIGGCEATATRYVFLHDNLLDLSHVTFLHHDTIGGEGVAATVPEISECGTHIEVVRRVKGDTVEHLPMAKVIGMTGLIDRTLPQWFFPPALHVTGSDFASAQDGGHHPGHVYGSLRVLHGITPETETTTHYFWAFSRNFRIGDEALTARVKDYITATVGQDKEGTAACEQLVSRHPPTASEIHAAVDRAAIQGRRMIQRLIDAESPNN
jgi:phenylpropionate dioxygenase-like ring-hydroxylating dioxygenase large terminal subunit